MKNKKIKTYIISIAIALSVGGLSAFLTKDNMNIYESIKTPPLSPPSLIFPIVWSILFVLMGISTAKILLSKESNSRYAKSGIFVYAISLVLNFFWSIFFFNCRWFLFSFIWLTVLAFFVALTIYYYKKADKKAAMLQLPYFIWVCFAGYLNFGIYLLNN